MNAAVRILLAERAVLVSWREPAMAECAAAQLVQLDDEIADIDWALAVMGIRYERDRERVNRRLHV